MESMSEPSRIHISESTYNLLPKEIYELAPRGELNVKGKGLMPTYWLTSCSHAETQTLQRNIIQILVEKLTSSSSSPTASSNASSGNLVGLGSDLTTASSHNSAIVLVGAVLEQEREDGKAIISLPPSLSHSSSSSSSPSPATSTSTSAPTFPYSSKIRILVVDDSSAQRKLVSNSLKATDLDVDVRTADSAEMAMELIRLSSYNMVLIDFNLSSGEHQRDGPDLVELLRASPQGHGCILVGMSTSIAKYADHFMSVGANATLPKPLPPTSELTAILKALHTQQDPSTLLASALRGAVAASSLSGVHVKKSREVLIVEDSTAQSKLMLRRLQDVGVLLDTHFVIMTCSSAEKALDAFRLNVDAQTGKSRFEVLLVDQNLSHVEGDMNGDELINVLRSSDLCSSLTLVFGCSSNFKGNAISLLSAGANHVFAKPLPAALSMAATLKHFALFAYASYSNNSASDAATSAFKR